MVEKSKTAEEWHRHFIQNDVDEANNESGMTLWGWIYLALRLKEQSGCKWASEMQNIFNLESTSIYIDFDSMTWVDFKHGDPYYHQPTKATWKSYKTWIKNTFGLAYEGEN